MNTDNAVDPEAAATSGPCGDIDSDDAALIAQSSRAPERFGVLFDRHAPAIYRYIALRLGRDTAEDLVAETFLAAFRQRARYDRARRREALAVRDRHQADRQAPARRSQVLPRDRQD